MYKIKNDVSESIFLLFWITMVIVLGLYENYKLRPQKITKKIEVDLNFPKPQESVRIIEIDLQESNQDE